MKTRFAVISDIHGNLEGLRAVLKSVDTENVSEILCLGDVIGYGADPEKCWEITKAKCSSILKGNHEAILAGDIDESQCSELGKQSAVWTRGHVTKKSRGELVDLPLQTVQYEASFFHSAPEGPKMWTYLNRIEQVLEAFSECVTPVVFYGHTHRPRVTLVKENDVVVQDVLIQRTTRFVVNLKEYRCYVNPGSVGQQRDFRTDASYAVCELDGSVANITVHRIPYKRFLAYQKIKRYGCGTAVAAYLIREKWRRNWFEIIDHRS